MRALMLLSSGLLIPLSLFSQDSTAKPSTPFRRGQWATQFAVASSFGSVGFLKFRSPTRALVLDLQLSGNHAESSVEDSTGASRFAGVNSNAFIQLRFGWRRYGGGEPKIVTHYTYGLLAGFNHGAATRAGTSSQQNIWSGGLFGDLGATYLVTPKLGLGALASASLAYSTSTLETQPGGGRSHSWQIGGSAVSASLVATLFF